MILERLFQLKRENKLLITIFLLAFVLRLSLIIFRPYPFYPVKIDDGYSYDLMARNILNGHGLSAAERPPYSPTIWRTPIYPLFLAGIYAIFGHSSNNVRIIQALLDSATCFLVYLIFLACFGDSKISKRFALSAYILAACCPFMAFFVSMIYSETLTTFLFTLSIYLFLLAKDNKKWKYFFIAGVSIGLAFLSRPVLSLFPLLLAAVMFFTEKKGNRKIELFRNLAVYFIALSLVWAPWICRNYISFKRFIPFSIGSGTFIWISTFPPARYEKDFLPDKDVFSKYLKLEGKELLDFDTRLKNDGLRRIKEYPFNYLIFTLKRVPLLWVSSYSYFIQIDNSFSELVGTTKDKSTNIKSQGSLYLKIFFKFLLSTLNIVLLITGILGIIFALKRWRRAYPILLVPIYITIIHAGLGLATPRYSAPAWPVFLIFSVYSVRMVSSILKDR